MKKRLFALLLFLAAGVTLSAQSLGDFDEIEVLGPFKVTLIQSENQKMEINYNGLDAEEVIADVNHGSLSIRLRNKAYYENWKSDSKDILPVYVTVYYKTLSELKAQAGASLKSSQPIAADKLTVNGSMGAFIDLAVDAKKLEVEANMGAEIRLTGSASFLDVGASMGSQVKAYTLKGESVSVKANMGGLVEVYASKDIDVSSTFGAVVNYVGDASEQHTNTTFGGVISKK